MATLAMFLCRRIACVPPLMASTGALARDQSDIAADLLAELEPLQSPDDQHEGQRRQWTYARVAHQPLRYPRGALLAAMPENQRSRNKC